MDTIHDTPTQDKQITIEVPAERVPEFYAFFGRFLAAEQFGRRGRRGHRGHGHCGSRREQRTEEAPAPATPAEPSSGPPAS